MEKEEPFTVAAWPNPTPGKVMVEMTGAGTGRDLRMELFSSQGVKLWDDTAPANGQKTLRIEGPEGVYLLRVTAGSHSRSAKVVKM